MGAFKWLMKKVTKAFGRNTNSLFYSLLYREILKEINNITKNEEDSLIILREIGKKASYESCERHTSIFKFMPGSPDKVLDYFEILWVVVFGKELEDFTYEEIPRDDSKYSDYLLKIKNCPICAGYGTSLEDTFDMKALGEDSEGMACGLCGMLESVANYILKVKKNNYRINILEGKCMAKGDEYLQLTCKIYDIKEWKEHMASKRDKKLSSKVYFEEKEEDFEQESKMDFVDELQNALSLDKLDEMLDEPLEGIKNRVKILIEEKLDMDPKNFFDYFHNYEDDMIRIIGFLAIHLLNEYGGLIEKTLKNDLFAKIAGYLFKQLREMMLLFVPIDVINDYHRLLVSFLDGLAPQEMVENVKSFSGKDDVRFFFEGAQIALENLGIDFSKLKDNIWEELQKQEEKELVSPDQSAAEKTKERFPKIINIIREILMLVNEFLTLPIRVLISEAHYGGKTAINAVVSEEEGLFGSIKERFDTIFDEVQELRH